jgi:hypothetical protein
MAAALGARGRDNPLAMTGTDVVVIFETVHGSRAYGLAIASLAVRPASV